MSSYDTINENYDKVIISIKQTDVPMSSYWML